MSEQEKGPDTVGSVSEYGDQESRFLPGARRIEARDITATNVVSGDQYIAVQQIHVHGVPGQPRIPPLLRPRRAEHFQDRAAEQAWLLDRLHPGQIVTISGPGGMGKTALVAEVLWSLVKRSLHAFVDLPAAAEEPPYILFVKLVEILRSLPIALQELK